MARSYKQATNHIKDSSNSTGGWNKICRFEKDTPNSGGRGTLEKVAVNFIVDDIDGADTLRSSFPFGHMFVLTREGNVSTVDGEASQLNPEHIIDVACRQGGSGSITLRGERDSVIAENANDLDEGDGHIFLWQKNTDLTVDDNVIMRYYVETYGRWIKCVDV